MATRRVENCPVTGLLGKQTRRMAPRELVALYDTYLGKALPEQLASRYFTQSISEYTCAESGLRWYSPAKIGDSDFYEFLGKSFDWYYQTTRWDKERALQLFPQLRVRSVAEIGCGDGTFLERLRERGIATCGVEINTQAIRRAQSVGLDVRPPDGFQIGQSEPIDALVMLQVLEHVPDPLGFALHYTKLFQPRYLVLSMPCYESLLGMSHDPLSWPPHHVTSWSPRGMQSLASRLGMRVDTIELEPAPPAALRHFASREPQRRLPKLAGILARLAHRRWGEPICNMVLSSLRILPRHWSRCSHSVMAVLCTHR